MSNHKDVLERKECLLTICDCLEDNSVMVEVGCLRGESCLIFNSSGKFKQIYCVDPWMPGYDDGDMNSNIDLSKVEKEFDKAIIGLSNVTKIKSFSIEAANNWSYGKLDLVYIDACHTHDALVSDIAAWLPHIKPGGIIAGHDYGKHDRWVEFPGIKQAVDEKFGKPDLILPDTSWVKFL